MEDTSFLQAHSCSISPSPFQGGLSFFEMLHQKGSYNSIRWEMLPPLPPLGNYLMSTGISFKATGSIIGEKLVESCMILCLPDSTDHRILLSKTYLPGCYKKDKAQRGTSENFELLLAQSFCLTESLARGRLPGHVGELRKTCSYDLDK